MISDDDTVMRQAAAVRGASDWSRGLRPEGPRGSVYLRRGTPICLNGTRSDNALTTENGLGLGARTGAPPKASGTTL